jgi:hypothetical protein
LALEAERWRLELRLRELAMELAAAEDTRVRDELTSLAPRLSAADEELGRLRGLLASLQARASDLRAAAATA